MSLDDILETWNNLYPQIKVVKVKRENHPSEEIKEIKEVTEELDALFNNHMLSLLKKDSLNRISSLLLDIDEELSNAGRGRSLPSDIVYPLIRNIDGYYNILQALRAEFNHIPDIVSYLAVYKKTYQMGEKAIEKAQKAYNERVAELLGKTTETYLFSEYQKQADAINKRILITTGAFFGIIIFLIIASIYSLIEIPTSQENNWIPYIFIRIFIAFTAFYALVFLNRSIRDDRKLEQTYRHKEVVSKSYLNYLDFLETNVVPNNNNKGEAINNRQIIKEKVSQIAVDSLGLNPALLLDKSTAEKIPMEELLSRILDKTTTKKGE
ncbi:hypothetical protein [Avibacterium paragallinarum]|uniref:hypothetical protein n=1 Tax=Avibacterium paragallinarum TaxID=728 RepID=UPI002280F087|nr:hypothetical protein [Avibacterium paragallinarum]WAL56293.1 hypothetical protein OY678_10000 [Avibacterium paragallinarum]